MKFSNLKMGKSTKGTPEQSVQLKSFGISPQEFSDRVQKKAYELYEDRGCAHGCDLEDWFTAEKIVEAELISGQGKTIGLKKRF